MKTTTSSSLQTLLKLLMILISAGWVCVWLLKPTELWTKAWRKVEDSARNTVFGYQGLDFVVYAFPVVAVMVTGFIYLHLHSKEQRSRQTRLVVTSLSNPVIIDSPLGMISGVELLAAVLFTIFLGWTVYAHISNDFKKMTPVKSLKLNTWQYKFMRFGTRFGLLAEACLALLLLPVLRGLAIFRLIGVQFEASIRYHIFLGTAMIFFATLHGLSTLFIWGIKHRLQDKVWKWQKTGRVYFAGEISLVIGLVIWVTSLPQIRRRKFELFYYTHHLYVAFLIFFLFHAGDRHFYMVFSGVLLFAVDKLLRIIQSRPQTCLLSARLFPCDVVELTLAKHPRLQYNPTSVIFLKVPSISKFQWHPFSITSSSSVDDNKITVLIKNEGQWTSLLYDKILAAANSSTHQVKCLSVAVEGPYGPTSMEFLRYDSLLLIAGGIGLTPFLSVLQELGSAQNTNKTGFPIRIHLVYATKKSRDISLLSPISQLLLNQSTNQLNVKVTVFVTQENRSATTIRGLMKEMPMAQTVHFHFCSNYRTSGIVNHLWMAAVAVASSVIFLIALICLNHAFLHSEKKSAEKKNPSWVTDILLMSSLIIAAICSTLVITITTWRNMKKDIPLVHQKQVEDADLSYLEANGSLEEHKVCYGERPNFEDIFSKFPVQPDDSDIGVLVCGPESMKVSVASSCKRYSQGANLGAKRRKPNFSFHSLSFSL